MYYAGSQGEMGVPMAIVGNAHVHLTCGSLCWSSMTLTNAYPSCKGIFSSPFAYTPRQQQPPDCNCVFSQEGTNYVGIGTLLSLSNLIHSTLPGTQQLSRNISSSLFLGKAGLKRILVQTVFLNDHCKNGDAYVSLGSDAVFSHRKH